MNKFLKVKLSNYMNWKKVDFAHTHCKFKNILAKGDLLGKQKSNQNK